MYEQTRGRFLAAMGLPLTTLALACQPGRPVGTTAPAETTPVAEVAPPTSPPADPPAVSPDGTAATIPQVEGIGSIANPSRDRGVSCPSGTFCVKAPASGPKEPAASDPRCEATARNPDEKGLSTSGSYQEATTETARATDPDACCYLWVQGCGGGRALRDPEGDAVATPAGRGAGWAPDETRREDSAEVDAADDALAAHWAREAAYEHASVASFARTTLELLALGAPAHLVAETQAAGLDEVRHAQALYGLARRFGASDAGPGPVATDRPLSRDAVSFAMATFEDACLGETIGALAARAAAGAAEDTEVADVLLGIAADEERHAELAWRTLAWAMQLAGDDARHALQKHVAVLEAQALAAPAPAQAQAQARSQRRDGRLDPAAAAEVHQRALVEVVLPCARALLA